MAKRKDSEVKPTETETASAPAATETTETRPTVVARTAEAIAAWISERVEKLGDMLKGAIAEGDVVASIREVYISPKASPTKVEASQEYLGLDAQNAKGMHAMNNGRIRPAKVWDKDADKQDPRTAEEKLYGACDWHNYGYDLNVRQGIRQQLMATLEGPEKAIANVVKSLRAMDIDDDMIRANVLKGKFSTHPSINAILDAALAPAGK